MENAKPWRQLSEKARRRLRIAARFLRQRGHKFEDGNFYEKVLHILSRIDKQEQEQLRGLVDWVEEYEMAEIVESGKSAVLPHVENQDGR